MLGKLIKYNSFDESIETKTYTFFSKKSIDTELSHANKSGNFIFSR